MGLVPSALAALANVTDVKAVLGYVVYARILPYFPILKVSAYDSAAVIIALYLVPLGV
jgi:hypothetical protein